MTLPSWCFSKTSLGGTDTEYIGCMSPPKDSNTYENQRYLPHTYKYPVRREGGNRLLTSELGADALFESWFLVFRRLLDTLLLVVVLRN